MMLQFDGFDIAARDLRHHIWLEILPLYRAIPMAISKYFPFWDVFLCANPQQGRQFYHTLSLFIFSISRN